MIEIEKGVPIPPRSWGGPGGSGRPSKYPFRIMEVGDSFHITGVVRNSVARYCAEAKRATGHQFSMRKTPDGYRVWRIA